MKKLGIAAQLAKRREPTTTPPAEEEEAPKIAAPIEAAADTNAEPLPESARALAALVNATTYKEVWEATSPEAVRKKPGPQRRPGIFTKRIFTLSQIQSDYIDTAWRSYRTADGRLVDSMSAFLDAIVAEHRERHRVR